MRILLVTVCILGVAWANPSVSKWWRWFDHTLIYGTLLDSDLTAKVEEVMKMYTAHTCINFKYDNTSTKGPGIWLDHYTGAHCGQAWLSRGHRKENDEITISPNCWTLGTIAHEIAHSLGFEHTQTRNDRDSFLETIERNTLKGYEAISRHYTENREFVSQDNFQIPYEYGSMLHYGGYWFEVKDSRYMNTVGQRTDITFYDYLAVNRFYECTCPTTSVACENGGYPNPRNCSLCNCPAGFGGATCTERPTACGEEFTASEDWKEFTGTFNYSNIRTNSMQTSDCVHWIKAPTGKGILIEITSYDSTADVLSSGLEILVEDDVRKSGVRVGQTFPATGVTALQTKRSLLPVRLYIGRRWDIETNKYVWGDIQKYTFRYKIDGISPISTTVTSPTTTFTTTLETTATWTTTASTSPPSPTTVDTTTTSTAAVTTPPTRSESETTITTSLTTFEVPEKSTTDENQHSTEPTPAVETTTVQTDGTTTEEDC